MEPLQQACLRINTDLLALPQVLEWFDQFDQPTIPHSIWLQCQLALAEGFTNAVRHAHKGQPVETPVEIEVKVFCGYMEMRIWDYGAGFDLEETLKKMPSQFNQTAEGGRGLKLMQRVANRLTYTRLLDQRNCLLIVKNYAARSEIGC